ncbi:lysophospholipid transporter LplT [Sideroxydans lithotrophicus]|uniref:Major facilitator superfamily MFS_1 n=1 Tax=Sideroxydans lithotrophicus (strain ES-1) TaxID=580332 RepID=D5CM89_SIDLE|nr:lysophospholipid transporter LplT [Sideroxydans lithotrophicus]ADE10703.1 major facilitator superfamily MFS_1 [Sideroxydans lithotrophicus ES-1]
MGQTRSLDMPLLSPGMVALLAAQFFSALADNAVLIAAIAIVKSQGLPHLVPLLQESFVFPFILLAAFVGQVADGFPKARVMLAANMLKLMGALAMLAGASPLAAYGWIGVGAAIYSPAKYGILSQMFGTSVLVRANGMMEGSTIVAILLGVVLGGWLADHSLAWAFAGVVSAYGLAAFANLFIPSLPAENAGAHFHPWRLIRQFAASLSVLFKNQDSRFSLLGTSVFWGSGTTLRLMLFAWVPAALLITDNQTPANLMGAVSIGIVLGAAAAAVWISLASVNRALLGGLLLGPAILALVFVHALSMAAALMVAIGFCGGLFVVPLNALLQQRGHETIGAGNALAVQNFAENIAMLLFVGMYSAAVMAGISVTTTVTGFGLILLAVVGALTALRLKRD